MAAKLKPGDVPELLGRFHTVYSPDDDAACGKGYYAELWWSNRTGPLFKTRAAAFNWACRNGGTFEHVEARV